MWNNADELVVGSTGEIYVAPIGTALPAKSKDALDPAFVGLGYTDEAGPTITVNPDFTEFTAWQSRSPVRREMTKQAVSVAFKLEQWNETSVPLAFGGGSVTSNGTGEYKYEPPGAGTAVDERILIIDVDDGSDRLRWIFFRGNATESVAPEFTRTTLALLPITFMGLAPTSDPSGPPFRLLGNSGAFAVGS